MSRRDNGLPAASYIRVVDVETHVVDGLLDRLREEEVAAYVAPAPGHRGPYGDTVLPGSPSDTVYVDSERTEHARGVVQRYLHEVREELAWAAIVAEFDSPTDARLAQWPVSEDVDDAAEPPAGTSTEPAPPAAPAPGALGDRWRSGATREDHFEPPPPPPLPVPDTINRFAWIAVLGGPLFLVAASMLRLEIAGWMGLLALVAFMAGFITLVARMKDRPPPGVDGDDGAVV